MFVASVLNYVVIVTVLSPDVCHSIVVVAATGRFPLPHARVRGPIQQKPPMGLSVEQLVEETYHHVSLLAYVYHCLYLYSSDYLSVVIVTRAGDFLRKQMR